MRRLSLAATLAAATSLSSAAHAVVYLDPATIHVGSGQGTTCVTGTGGSPSCPQFNNEVNPFGPNGVDLYQNSGGANPLISPVLAILLVPNSPGTLPPGTITAAHYYATASTVPVPVGTSVGVTVAPAGYSLIYANPANGYVGSFNGNQNVYDFLGAHDSDSTFQAMFQGGDASVNFTNLHNAALAVDGVDATSFGVYVYGINTGSFAAGNVLDLTIPSTPDGSFVVGFGYQGSVTSNPNPYDTPFTEAAIDAPPAGVPEPASLALFGVGLLGLGFVTAKRRN